MSVQSAGILPYRWSDNGLEVLLVHPGGPFWSGKDEGAWSIPKGIYEEIENPLQAAKREFREETGFDSRRRVHGFRHHKAAQPEDNTHLGS